MAAVRGAFDSKDFGGVLRKIAVWVLAIGGTDYRWQAYIRDDLEGQALAPVAVAGAVTVATATATASTALAASTTRLGFQFQNLSDDTVLWWQFGGTPLAGACFKLVPGQTIVREGDTHCRDSVRVITASATTADYVIQPW